ncbi:spermatogenesis-associated protein 24-like isoform X2 [Heterodontus francisci]|uniref:spermatogenesis-associated protein 24-like isoform X2 n=1 Tax=Heterodontus francisci TaxID=7792 RepID=UPI00355C8505
MAEGETHSLVHRQLRDIVLLQQRKIRSFGEMNERLEHAKTKALLSKESEKLQFALGEIEILMKQLDREKKAFENALESIKNKAVKESTKNDKLISKCSEIESQMEKQDDILSNKEDQIKELCHLLAKQKDALKQQVTDFEIQKQQDAYIARVLKEKKRKTFQKFHHAPK